MLWCSTISLHNHIVSYTPAVNEWDLDGYSSGGSFEISQVCLRLKLESLQKPSLGKDKRIKGGQMVIKTIKK